MADPAQTPAQAEISIQARTPTPFAVGTAGIGADLDYVSAHTYLIKQTMALRAGAQMVQVVAVTNAGGLSPIGTVDVTPLVNQIDGLGNGTPHGTIHGLPYFRISNSGGNAIILDPAVGDVGYAVFCDRDISVVKKTGKRANPGSRRQNDMADGLYCGTVVGQTPTQVIQFNADGITIISPTKITLQAPIVEVDAPQIILNGLMTQGTGSNGGSATMQGPVTVNADLTANGTSVHTHRHSGVQGGSGDTGEPV
jgi:hypothetical protein